MELTDFFKNNKKCALGYSGGVDSAYLLYKAISLGVDIKPYFIKSAFQTESELKSAIDTAEGMGAKVSVIEADIFSSNNVINNDKNRCYHCKKHLFSQIINAAKKDGYETVIEGTNASDIISDRPGYKAITELGVLSPLLLCGVTKDILRCELKTAGIDIWDKSSSACLATRIPCGQLITSELLNKVKYSEELLRDLGFNDFRVRIFNNATRIQLKSEQFAAAMQLRNQIYSGLSRYFDVVLLDLKER